MRQHFQRIGDKISMILPGELFRYQFRSQTHLTRGTSSTTPTYEWNVIRQVTMKLTIVLARISFFSVYRPTVGLFFTIVSPIEHKQFYVYRIFSWQFPRMTHYLASQTSWKLSNLLSKILRDVQKSIETYTYIYTVPRENRVCVAIDLPLKMPVKILSDLIKRRDTLHNFILSNNHVYASTYPKGVTGVIF